MTEQIKPKRKMWKQQIKSSLLSLLLFTTVFCFMVFVKPVAMVVVKGQSMNPTLKEQQHLLLLKWKPSRNDIAVFHAPKEWNINGADYVKRVIGIPGDKITISETKLLVNDIEVLDFSENLANVNPITFVLKDEYFMVGDNVGYSKDSLTTYIMGYNVYTVPAKDVEYKLLFGGF